MSDELISQYVDHEAISGDTKFLLDEIGKGIKAIEAANAAVKSIRGATSSKGIAEGAEIGTKANAMLAESIKAVNAVVNQRFASEAKLVTVATDYNKATVANRLELQKQNKELKDQAALNAANTGSIEKAQAAVKVLSAERNKLNLYTKEGQERQAELNSQIDKYNAFIKKSVDNLSQQKINVGNYGQSAKIIVDALEKEKKKLEELEKTRVRVQNAGGTFNPGAAASRTTVTGFAGAGEGISNIASAAPEATVELKKLDDEIERSRTIVEGFQRVTEQPKFLNVAGKMGDATQELKFFTKALIELERQGQGNSEAAITLRKHLAELTDQVGDAKAEIKALSSDTRSFDLFAGSVSFAADALQTFAGAAVLAGASEEDAAEATRTLVAVQSVANGVKGIANELTTRGTAANKLYAFSQAQMTIAMDATATAGARLRAVLATLGFGAVIVGIGLLIANFGKIKDAITGATTATKAYTETLADYSNGAQEAIEKTNKVGLAFEQAKKGVISKDEALKIYNETLGDTFGKATSLAEAEKLYTDKASTYIEMMGLKAQANALFAASAQAMAAGLIAANEDQVNMWDEFKQSLTRESFFSGVSAEQRAKIQAEKVKKIREKSEADSKALYDKGAELANKMEQLGKGKAIDLDPDKEKKPEKKKAADDSAIKDALEAEKRKNAAIRQQAIENANEIIRINQQVVDSENSAFKDKLGSLDKISEQRKLIAGVEFAAAIENAVKIENGKRVVVAKSNEEIELAKTQNANKVNAINDDLLKSQQAAQKENTEKLKAEYEKDRQARIESLEKTTQALRDADKAAYDQAIIALNNKKLSEEDYNKQRAKIEIDYQLASVQREIQYQKDLLAIIDLPQDKRAEALRQLADLEMQLSDATKENHKKNEAEKLADTLKTLDTIKEVSGLVFEFIGGMLNANAIAQKNKLEEQGKANEERAQKEIEAINASTLAEQEKAAKIAVINARLAAQKDQIARKEKEADLKKAEFDKAAAIFNIILSTAQAVMKAAPVVPLMIFAAAAGAIQLGIAIATPVPKYKYGKGAGDNYEGLAIVGDGGKSELIEHEDGSMEVTPAVPTLTHVKKKDIIHPDKDAWLNAILNAAYRDANANMKFTPAKNNAENKINETLIKGFAGLSNTIKNKREITIKGISGKDIIFRDGSNSTTYLNNNLQS